MSKNQLNNLWICGGTSSDFLTGHQEQTVPQGESLRVHMFLEEVSLWTHLGLDNYGSLR